MSGRIVAILAAFLAALSLAACSGGASRATSTTVPTRPTSTTAVPTTAPEPTSRPSGTTGAPRNGPSPAARPPLPVPASLTPFAAVGGVSQGRWSPAGRPVDGSPAIYETSLVPPGGSEAAGIAWMDTHRLVARLYSGSKSPGGGPYRFTAPIQPAQAATLDAAFNGGFVMNVAGGGYYTEGKAVDPLRAGAASLVIYSNGTVDVGPWGNPLTLTPAVTSVRQNLAPLVAGGQPTALAASADWLVWGNTCGATSCAHSVPSVEHQWRSGIGVTANGALVYVTGPDLAPLQLAQVLVRAGVVRGMQLDVNPFWTVLATYQPAAGGLAAPGNGERLVAGSIQGPATFFNPSWNRDFITMSVAPGPPSP